MRNIKSSESGNRFRLHPLALMGLVMGFLIILGGLTPLPPLAAYSRSTATSASSAITSPSHLSPASQKLLQGILPEHGDLGAFIVNADGAMSAAIVSTGGVGAFHPLADYYNKCMLAIGLFRWGDYEQVTGYVIQLLTNGSGGADMSQLLAFLDLLPPNALLMLFSNGTATDMLNWGISIAGEFTATLNLPFQRILGLPPLSMENMTFGIEAYAYSGTPEQGRDAYALFMHTMGSTRHGMSELVTQHLADESAGGIGLCGVVNTGMFGNTSLPAITMASWVSLHKDQFYGNTVHTFDLNAFVGRTGSISLGLLDALEFTALFPAGVNITSYQPADMTNSTGPEGVMVGRSTATWQNQSTVADIIINFEGDFPPGLLISRTIVPNRVSPRATATVQITLKNNDTVETVYNVTVDDSHAWDYYASLHGRVTVTGATTGFFTGIDPGETRTLTYTVVIDTEGSYVANRTLLSFQDAASLLYHKTTARAYVAVAYANVFEFLFTILTSLPWSIPVILVVGLMLLYLIIWLVKSLLGLRRRPNAPPAKRAAKAAPARGAPAEPATGAPPSKLAKAELTCINCGSLIPPGVQFCPACGQKIPE
jgi:hypothetical protein